MTDPLVTLDLDTRVAKVAFHLDLFPVIRANTEKLQKPKRVHANKTKSGGES